MKPTLKIQNQQLRRKLTEHGAIAKQNIVTAEKLKTKAEYDFWVNETNRKIANYNSIIRMSTGKDLSREKTIELLIQDTIDNDNAQQ